MLYVGVDGCPNGWFTVALGEGDEWEANWFENISEILEHYPKAKLILIDIPIGLPDKNHKERACDREARKLLKPVRHSSVFPTPCRASVYSNDYHEAQNINLREIGKGLSKQTWAIIPKIRQVDQILQESKPSRIRIKEIHPEVCFLALNPEQARMTYSKKEELGFRERRKVLKFLHPCTDEIIKFALREYRRSKVAKDDILDALIAAITASKEKYGLSTVPEIPESDSTGLPMAITFVGIIAQLRDNKALAEALHRCVNADYLKDHIKEDLENTITPLLKGEEMDFLEAMRVIEAIIFVHIDLLGYLYCGKSEAVSAVKFMRDYLGSVDARYKQIGGVLYTLLRHGSIHKYTPMRLELNNGLLLDFQYGLDSTRTGHLKVIKVQNGKHLVISLALLYKDLLSAIDLFYKDIRSNQKVSDIFERAFKSRRTPLKENAQPGYCKSDMPNLYELLEEKV